MRDPPRRPRDGRLQVLLYGKTADLIRAEASRREMGYDRLVSDIIWTWAMNLRWEREQQRHRPDDPHPS